MKDGRARRMLLLAAQLVDDLDGQRRRESLAFADGFRIGYQDGYEVGYGHAVVEMDDEWARVAQAVRRVGRRETHDELARRRAAPGPSWRQYQGGPVDWDGQTQPPVGASA